METEYHYKEVIWDEVSDVVKNVNPELARIVDKIAPDKSYKLIKATYRFGDLIVDRGHLQIRQSSGLSTVDSDQFPGALKTELLFTPIPLGLLLNKTGEVFVTESERVIPLKVFSPGILFGTFETSDFIFGLDSYPRWSVSAGSRSIFSLSKLSDSVSLKKVQAEFSIPQTFKIQSLADHWELFRKIAMHENFLESWSCEVIFFTRKWFEHKKNDALWSEFILYLCSQTWRQSRQSLTKHALAINWPSFIRTLTARRLQPNPYMIDTLRHLFLISVGEAPAFKPITDAALSAPVEGIQKAISEIYGLKKYAPSLMHAVLRSHEKRDSLYYSLAYPTLLEGSPDSKTNSSTIMLDTRNLKLFIETLYGNPDISHSVLKNKKFDYFHVEQDKYGEIQSSDSIPQTDKNFRLDRFEGLEFCSTSPFWRGCVQLQFKP